MSIRSAALCGRILQQERDEKAKINKATLLNTWQGVYIDPTCGLSEILLGYASIQELTSTPLEPMFRLHDYKRPLAMKTILIYQERRPMFS